jgi:hypothetical protein
MYSYTFDNFSHCKSDLILGRISEFILGRIVILTSDNKIKLLFFNNNGDHCTIGPAHIVLNKNCKHYFAWFFEDNIIVSTDLKYQYLHNPLFRSESKYECQKFFDKWLKLKVFI